MRNSGIRPMSLCKCSMLLMRASRSIVAISAMNVFSGGRWCGVTTMVSRSESKERNVGVSSVREVSALRPLLAGLNGVNINGSFNIDFMDISPYSSPLIQLLFITGRIGSIQVRYPNLLQIGGAIHRPLPALGNIPGFKATEGLAIFL
nr:hypothetical protein Itr_chr12CG29250 [Ipomoea trifida]